MDLQSGMPFWSVKNGLIHAYPRLHTDLRCDALIVGAGITGSLIADALTRAGLAVAVIDRREAGNGSTAASTALLQYEIDTEMCALRERYGEADAVLAYRSCANAVTALGKIAKPMRGVGYEAMRSLYYASRRGHEQRLRQEADLRQRHGFQLQVLEAQDLQRRFGISAPVALLSDLAGAIDPYQLAHGLLKRVHARGGQVHGRTTLAEFKSVRGGIKATTGDACTIHCRQLIFAAGYESQNWLAHKVARNRSSYAFMSEPVQDGLGCLARTMVWESARPYLYLRRTADRRVLVGGEDDQIDIPWRRDLRVARKAQTLHRRCAALFPEVSLKIAFAWAGTFAETEDGLPFFGPHEQHGPRVHFAMAYGGNGITYSLIGAEILKAALTAKEHPAAQLFSFQRLQR